MIMCAVDWGLIAAWIAAISSVGLFCAAVLALKEWKSQFFKTRDHDLALRVVRSVAKSYIMLDELRTPHALISDDQPPPPEADGPDPDFEYRVMSSRYRSRIRHLSEVVEERTALVDEIRSLWDDDSYGDKLGMLINELGIIENNVKTEASNLVMSLRRDASDKGYRIDKEVLYSPSDYTDPDPVADSYEAAKEAILVHLKPKIRLS